MSGRLCVMRLWKCNDKRSDGQEERRDSSTMNHHFNVYLELYVSDKSAHQNKHKKTYINSKIIWQIWVSDGSYHWKEREKNTDSQSVRKRRAIQRGEGEQVRAPLISQLITSGWWSAWGDGCCLSYVCVCASVCVCILGGCVHFRKRFLKGELILTVWGHYRINLIWVSCH